MLYRVETGLPGGAIALPIVNGWALKGEPRRLPGGAVVEGVETARALSIPRTLPLPGGGEAGLALAAALVSIEGDRVFALYGATLQPLG